MYQLHAPEKQAVGLPIKIRWQAASGHSATDWIGLYRYEPDMSRQITSISSHGRWQFVGEGTLNGTMGEMVFSGDQLFWEAGLFELRYHCDGIHKVISICKPITLYCLLIHFLRRMASFINHCNARCLLAPDYFHFSD